eukprot:20813-Prymnesium_polylepis.1
MFTVRSASPGRRLRRACYKWCASPVELVEPMSSDPAESRLGGRVSTAATRRAPSRVLARLHATRDPGRDF